MKYELSHDSIAAQITAKLSHDAKARREVEAKVLSAGLHRYRQSQGKKGLTEDELDLIKPYESVIRFTDEEARLIQDSKNRHAKRRLYRRLLTVGIIAILSLATAISLWLWQEAKQRAREAQSAEFAAKAQQALEGKHYADALIWAYQSRVLQDNPTATQVLATAYHQAYFGFAPLSIGAFFHEGKAIKQVVIAPDQKHLLTVTEDSTVWLWSIPQNFAADRNKSGHLVRKLKGFDTDFIPVFAPDSKSILLQNVDYQLERHSLENASIEILRGHTDYVQAALFSRDGQKLASCGDDGKVWILRGGNKTPELIRQTLNGDRVMAIEFFDKGKRLVSFGEQDSVESFDFETQTVQRFAKTDYTASGESEVPVLIYKAAVNGDYVQFHHTTLPDVVVAQVRHEGVKGTVFADDGLMVASYSDDSYVRLWRSGLKNPNETAENSFDTEGGANLYFDPTENQVLEITADKATIRDRTGQQKAAWTIPNPQTDRARWSADGKQILLQHENGLTIWTNEGQLLSDKIHVLPQILDAHFAPNDQRILVTLDDTSAFAAAYFDRQGQMSEPLQPIEKASVVDFSPNGRDLAWGAWTGAIRIKGRGVATAKRIYQSDELIRHLSWLPDSRHLLALVRGPKGDDLIELDSQTENPNPKTIASNVLQVWFSANRAYMLLAFDESVVLYRTSGKRVYELSNLSGLQHARFSADAKLLFLSLTDGRILTYYLPDAIQL
jgi:WD40 repeat protein